jgi:hypothetical protein
MALRSTVGVQFERSFGSTQTIRLSGRVEVCESVAPATTCESAMIHSDGVERCGTGKGYLIEAQSGSFRPSGLRIKRAEV